MFLLYCFKCAESCLSSVAIPNNPGYTCPTCQEGLYYFGREQASISDKAVLNAYDKANEIDPIKTYEGRSNTYQNVPYDEDILHCEEALKYNPNNNDALLHLAKLYQSRNHLAAAEEKLIKIIKNDKKNIKALQMASHLALSTQKFVKAKGYLEQLLAADEDNAASIYFDLAIVQHFLGDNNAALTDLEESTKCGPDENLMVKLDAFKAVLQTDT